jgi:hypothetical protein
MALRSYNLGQLRAVFAIPWTGKDREAWFSLGENHEKANCFGLHQLRNCYSPVRVHELFHYS